MRVPDNAIALALLEMLGEPLMTTTVRLGEAPPMTDPREIFEAIGHQVDIVIDGGIADETVSTLVDLTDPEPAVLREGAGDLYAL